MLRKSSLTIHSPVGPECAVGEKMTDLIAQRLIGGLKKRRRKSAQTLVGG